MDIKELLEERKAKILDVINLEATDDNSISLIIAKDKEHGLVAMFFSTSEQSTAFDGKVTQSTNWMSFQAFKKLKDLNFKALEILYTKD